MDSEIKKKATSASYPPPQPEGDGQPKPREVLKTLREQLTVQLSQEERLDLGLELARAEGEIADHDASAQQTKADLKAKETAIRARISALSTSLRNGTKLAEVEVKIEADFERNVAVYVRADNGKVLRERPLDPTERQKMLGLEEPAKTETPKPGEPEVETPPEAAVEDAPEGAANEDDETTEDEPEA